MTEIPPGMETERLCPECGEAFLYRAVDDTLQCPGCGERRLSEAQLETINNIEPRGFHLDEGTPCECGPEPYSTTEILKCSDFAEYTHRCGDCGNEFTTYIEG